VLFRSIDRINRAAGYTCVSFVGPQPSERLNLMYNAADVFVNSARSEGWCNAINEALAVGTPVVATDVGGNREQVHSPGLGLIVPEGDSDALADGVIAALDRRWDRSSIAAAAARRTWHQVACEVEAVFERVLAGRRSECVSDLSAQVPAQRHAGAQALEVSA
jgi:glycosyltransferase involved in cell wall biosynthesis